MFELAISQPFYFALQLLSYVLFIYLWLYERNRRKDMERTFTQMGLTPGSHEIDLDKFERFSRLLRSYALRQAERLPPGFTSNPKPQRRWTPKA